MRLNLGAGGRRDPGWTHVDRAGDGVVLLDLRDEVWPWEPCSVDGIVLHHVLSLLTFEECVQVLTKCHEVLRPASRIRVSDANIAAGVLAAITGHDEFFVEPRGSREETLGFFITQGGARRQYLDTEYVQTLLWRTGFASEGYAQTYTCDVGETLGPSWMTDLDDRANESFFVEALRT